MENKLNDKITKISLEPGEEGMMHREGVSAHFNTSGQLQVAHEGQTVTVYDENTGLMTSVMAEMKTLPVADAPAVMWHKIGRLTDRDIGQTITAANDDGEVIGIYMGVTNLFNELGGNPEIRIYASITDIYADSRRRVRLHETLEGHSMNRSKVKLIKDQGFRLEPALSANYWMNKRSTLNEIRGLFPGQLTDYMLPPIEILSGHRTEDDPQVVFTNNMYDLRHTGDFAKANNGGYDSRFADENCVGSHSTYLSSSTTHQIQIYRHGSKYNGEMCVPLGCNFEGGKVIFDQPDIMKWNIRTIIAQRAPL